MGCDSRLYHELNAVPTFTPRQGTCARLWSHVYGSGQLAFLFIQGVDMRLQPCVHGVLLLAYRLEWRLLEFTEHSCFLIDCRVYYVTNWMGSQSLRPFILLLPFHVSRRLWKLVIYTLNVICAMHEYLCPTYWFPEAPQHALGEDASWN